MSLSCGVWRLSMSMENSPASVAEFRPSVFPVIAQWSVLDPVTM